MRNKNDSWFLVAVGAAVACLVITLIVVGVVFSFKTDTITCTVNDKDRTRDSDGNSDARVYTDDCGTLRVGDSLLSGTWSSSDTYASIKPGNTYEFDTRGVRVPFFSMFPNIVKVREK